jgi:hypothetical protein
MKLTLHKLPEGFIVTSDEEIKDVRPHKDKLHLEKGYILNTFPDYLTDLSECKLVIAQQDQIDFSALSEEEQKETGWFDVEKALEEILSKEANYNNYWKSIIYSNPTLISAIQELLSDRRFTLEDIRHSLIELIKDTSCEDGLLVGKSPAEAYKWIESYIKSLSVKSWEIEVEMEINNVDYAWDLFKHDINKQFHFHHYVSGIKSFKKEFEHLYQQPKFTNGKIKILKIK